VGLIFARRDVRNSRTSLRLSMASTLRPPPTGLGDPGGTPFSRASQRGVEQWLAARKLRGAHGSASGPARKSRSEHVAISDAARRNHDELFPDRVSTLAQTDPELVEYFDNWAFDEVISSGSLDVRTRLMVQLASMIASHAVSEYRMMLGAALTVGVTPVEAKEIVYQAVPYVGMAKVFDVLHATNDVVSERGVELPLPGQATTTPQTRFEKGLEVQKRVIGAERVDAMHASAPEDEQHIQRFLSANCFGDHLTRTGIDVPTRELLTFAMLAALGGCEPQLKGHVAANVNVGNDRARLLDVLTQLLPYIGYPRTLNALRVLDEVTLA
jgi:4-carboxymuconolactone decarboxylase